MSKKNLTRRDFVRLSALGSAGLLAACAAPTPQVVKEVVKEQVEVTRVVQVAGTPKVETVIQEKEKVVTATPAPTAKPAAVTDHGLPSQ